MPFIIRPAGVAGFAGAQYIEADTLPAVFNGLDPGNYQVGRIAWADNPVTVAAPPATGGEFFTTTNAGPWFRDPDGNLAEGYTRMRALLRFRIKDTADTTLSGYRWMVSQSNTGFDIGLSITASDRRFGMRALRDNTNATLISTTTNPIHQWTGLAFNQWYDFEFDVNMLTHVIRMRRDAEEWIEYPMTSAAGTTLQAGRIFTALNNNAKSAHVQSGIDIGKIELLRTKEGIETQYLLIEGNAANANAHPWKMLDSGNAA